MPFPTQSAIAASALTPTEVTKLQVSVDNAMGSVCLGKLSSANMNITTDQAIVINSSNYIVRKITITNASVSLTTAAGGIYPTTSKGGTALVTAGQVYTVLTASTKFLDLTLAAGVGTDRNTSTNLYFSLTTGQGVAATADIYVWGDKLD